MVKLYGENNEIWMAHLQKVNDINNRGISIVHLNIGSGYQNLIKSLIILGQMKLGTTIFELSETWLNDTMESLLIKIIGYQVFRRDKSW